MTPEQQTQLYYQAGKVFNPNIPINEKDLFSGRTKQISRVLDVIIQQGQHAIIFGERGVGKTSLANVLAQFFPFSQSTSLLAARVNCDKQDDFESIWRKVFNEMKLTITQPVAGFNAANKDQPINSEYFFSNSFVAPDDVRKALLSLSTNFLPVLIIDEFDRLKSEVRKIFADLIKNLSDHALTATIVLIGVGDSVEHLIREHQSVSRALVQIQMPRMTSDEIKDIINTGLNVMGMAITDQALEEISFLSQGLPHYTHLIGLYASRDAINKGSLRIADENINDAIGKAINDAQQSIRTNYINAIKSTRKDNLFGEVLLACALAQVNELGEFAAQDVRDPMFKITGKVYEIPAFAKHLNKFSDDTRGKVLSKSGQKRLYRYRFSDPLMQPYIIMQGILAKKISPQSLISAISIPSKEDTQKELF